MKPFKYKDGDQVWMVSTLGSNRSIRRCRVRGRPEKCGEHWLYILRSGDGVGEECSAFEKNLAKTRNGVLTILGRADWRLA